MPVGLLYVEQAEFNSAECRPPRVYPLPGQVIVGYQIVEPDPSGCSCDLKLEVPTVLAGAVRTKGPWAWAQLARLNHFRG